MKKYVDDDFNEVVGLVLREKRIQKGYSLSQLGEKVGSTKQNLQRYEKALIRLKVDMFNKICKELGLSPNEILDEINLKCIQRNKVH